MSRRKESRQESIFDLEIHPETKLGIFAIFSFLLGALAALGLFGKAGNVGSILDNALAVIFGIDRFLFPMFLAALGIIFLKPLLRPRARHWIGLILLILSANAMIHILTFDYHESISGANLGEGGGYLGLIFSYPLDRGLGLWASLAVIFALIIISLLLISRAFVKNTVFFTHSIIVLLILRARAAGRLIRNLFKRGKHTNLGDSFTTHDLTLKDNTESEILDASAATTATSSVDSQTVTDLPKKKRPRPAPINLPLDLLSDKTSKPNGGDIKTNQLIISKTLENFGIEVEMGDVSVGPTVTQYTLKPAEGIKLSRITALSNDLALALAAHPIRIEAPIPGKSLVGIEVPNQTVARVTLREIFESDEYKKNGAALAVAIGKDVAGRAYISDIARMPHILVAGSTGSGKTVCLNSMIVSLLYRNQPDQLKLILIDPKRVELPVYNGIPHLLAPVITEVPKVVNALRWSIKEMERRFDILSTATKRDIESYNKSLTFGAEGSAKVRDKTAEERMPYIVIIIDELADLMVSAASEVEGSIIRLAQMARAVGIHLVIATQRPSVDVITGLIKANITSRIAFAVASQTDSRTILDGAGAEKLLGRGDMLFTSAELSKPKRLQGAFLSDEEIVRIVEHIKKASEAEPEYNEEITERVSAFSSFSDASHDGEDPLFAEAKDTVLRAGKASASLLQRRLKIGYARAARLLDIMEEAGIIGPADGAKPREVLLAFDKADTIDSVKQELSP